MGSKNPTGGLDLQAAWCKLTLIWYTTWNLIFSITQTIPIPWVIAQLTFNTFNSSKTREKNPKTTKVFQGWRNLQANICSFRFYINTTEAPGNALSSFKKPHPTCYQSLLAQFFQLIPCGVVLHTGLTSEIVRWDELLFPLWWFEEQIFTHINGKETKGDHGKIYFFSVQSYIFET